MKKQILIISLMLLLLASLVYSFTPKTEVFCCWDLKEGRQLGAECSNLNINQQTCKKVLDDYAKIPENIKTNQPIVINDNPTSVEQNNTLKFGLTIAAIFVLAILLIIWYVVKKK